MSYCFIHILAAAVVAVAEGTEGARTPALAEGTLWP